MTRGNTRLHVLFLQGPASFFSERLARMLLARGHRVSRINLNFGDRLFWRLPARNYRGSIAGWRGYIARQLDAEPITHLLIFGDMRPHHRIAIEEARRRGIDIVCTELGYLRPDWVALERDGVNSNSRMPRDPAVIRALAQRFESPDFTVRTRTAFWRFAMLDIAYYLSAHLFWPLYPGYRRHAVDHPVVEYASWIGKWASSPIERRKTRDTFAFLRQHPASTFILPLQLSTDFQIRAHSHYPDMTAAAREIIVSFAAHAPRDARLLVKAHPLDCGLTRWRPLIRRMAADCGVESRVFYVDGGNLDDMFRTAAGCVTVNSTSGLAALQAACPLKVTGRAIFDVPGLSFQGTLDDFWTQAAPPEPQLVRDYIRLLAGAVHVRGNLFTKAGIEMAAAATVHRLEEGLPWLPPKDAAANCPDVLSPSLTGT